jgi:tRNA A-37 threonylcarbamoyl transferase component Bud32
MSGIPAGAGSLLGKRLGKYEILALLALGGTAEIYLARIGGAAGFEKYVVVKCLHDHLADDMEFVKMFLDEARLAAHLDHSNIVQTMELGEHQNRYYMVMEFLGGLSLAMVVRRAPDRMPGGKMPVPLVLNIMAQAAAGLHYAHERSINGKFLNIVHRDISPQNLVLSFEGVVKVVDFGIAKAEMRETSTRSGTIKGKFAYMSPEQCVANNVDRRTDVFALGVIAHELLTGGRLFKRNSPYETYQAVIDCNVPPPSKLNVELDPAIDGIVMRALAKDKEQRYPTAEAFGDALLGYLHHRGKGSGPNEVARFFDASFAQEIEEHGARMRELIEGRADVAEVAPNWSAEEEERERARERDRKRADSTVDLGGRGSEQSLSLATGDIEMLAANRSSLSNLIADLGSPPGDDEEMPADRTRIESNPLDKIAEHEAAQAKKKPVMPPSGALPLPPAPSGKFPDVPNMSTQIIDEPVSPKASQKTQIAQMPQANLKTQIAAVPARLQRPTAEQAAPFSPASQEKTRDAKAYVSPAASRPTQLPMMAQQPPSNIEVRPSLMSQPVVRPNSAPMPISYPVLDAQRAAEVPATARNHAQVQAVLQRAEQQHHQQPPAAVIQFSPNQDRAPDSGVYVNPPIAGYDPHRAANMMSPVGPSYPQQDWDAAAAKPAKAVPPWMFAILFVVGFGLALALTILIAKAVH